jgi:hypothetical protein
MNLENQSAEYPETRITGNQIKKKEVVFPDDLIT